MLSYRTMYAHVKWCQFILTCVIHCPVQLYGNLWALRPSFKIQFLFTILVYSILYYIRQSFSKVEESGNLYLFWISVPWYPNAWNLQTFEKREELEVYLQFMAFAWQNNYCSVLCHGIYVRTLITLNYTFPNWLFLILLNDCLLKKGKNRKNNLLVFVSFWYIIVSLGQLNLEKKKM